MSTYLPGAAGEVEREVAEELEGRPVIEPGEEGYDDLRTRLIEAAQTNEELDAIYQRYPAHDPQAAPQARRDQALADRNAALEEADTPEEIDEVYRKYPLESALPGSDQQREYEKALSEAETPEEADAIYERFGKPPAVHS